MNEDNTYTVVWKSNKIDNSLNPIWAPVKIPMATLCNNDLYRPLKIEIFDWEKSGKHQSMGQVIYFLHHEKIFVLLFAKIHCANTVRWEKHTYNHMLL
jgi:hypothetical protein